MNTLKITKGNAILEYTGSAEDLKDMVRDFLLSDVKNPITTQPPNVVDIIEPPQTHLESEKPKFPSKEELIDYITSKPEFEHTGAELQKKFLGRRLDSRKDQKLYLSFYGIIDRAKNRIAKQHGGEWKMTGNIALGTRTRIPIFKFVKFEQVKQPDENQIVSSKLE